MKNSHLSFYFCVNIDTPAHLAPLSDGYGGYGTSVRSASASLFSPTCPDSISDRVDVQTVTLAEWEHGYAFPERAEGETVDCLTFNGWATAWDARHIFEAVYAHGEPCETFGILDGFGHLPALSLQAETPSSVVTAYVCVLYRGEPCSAPSARRAVRAYQDGCAYPQADTDAERPEWTR